MSLMTLAFRLYHTRLITLIQNGSVEEAAVYARYVAWFAVRQ